MTYVVCDRLLDPETNEHCEYDGDIPVDHLGYWICPSCRKLGYVASEKENEE